MKKQRILSLLLSLVVVVGTFAQKTFTLSGVVKDTHGEPIFAAAVALKGTPNGGYTDENGHYQLSVSAGKYVLAVSMVGYESQEQTIHVRSDKQVDFVLKESSVRMDAVQVYGKSKAQQLREGAYTVNAMNVKSLVNTTQNLNAIVNRTTGVKVREEGGLGSDFNLSINGMSGNSIRYFIDGMPLDAKGSGVTLANLPPNIIDRIEIYKGDLTTDKRTELMYNGKPLPYSMGTFAQFAVVRDDKIYLATNPETAAPGIYIYDMETEQMTKGLSVQEGYSFRRLVPMEREKVTSIQ